MASIESEVAKRLKEHRQDQLSLFSNGEDERARLERMKSERAESDHYYVKNIVSQIERRMDEEAKHRMKTEDEMRHMIDNKFLVISEKLRAEEKMGLERERRLMQQFQEGMTTMNEIIRGAKEQNLISLTHQQTVLGDQIKSLFQGMETMKESVFTRQGAIEIELNEQRQKMLDLEQATLKHAQTVNETLENEISRFERVIAAFEKYIDTQTGDLRTIISRQADESLKWKSEFEDLNTKKIIEIHNALKLLNVSIGKVNSDSKDRFDMIA